MSLNEDVAAEIQKLDPSAVIELFELDTTDQGGDVFRFHNGTNKLSQNIVWQGEEYIRFPIEVRGFETNGQGQFPRPTVVVSNTLSSITTVLMLYKDFIGAKFTRRRTFLKYLDAVNFPGGVNPDADDTVTFTDDIFYVDRKVSENRDTVQFELASVADLQGVKVPKRTVIQSTCPWIYRGADCGYTGIPLYGEDDQELPLPVSTEALAMRAAYQDYLDSVTALEAAQEALSDASDALTASQIYSVNTQYNFDLAGPKYYVQVSPFATKGVWNDVEITLGTQYTRGGWKSQVFVSGVYVDTYEIQENTRDEGAVVTAQAAYDAAVIARDAAIVVKDTAIDDFDTALSAVPSDDAVYTQDRCGKRLTSCKIRFGSIYPNSPINFGGFPGVSRR